MQDGSWIQVAEGKFVNLHQVACVEEAGDATILYAGGAGPPPAGIRVTEGGQRRLVSSFIQERTAKQLATAGGH
jgi:hypothetical protein